MIFPVDGEATVDNPGPQEAAGCFQEAGLKGSFGEKQKAKCQSKAHPLSFREADQQKLMTCAFRLALVLWVLVCLFLLFKNMSTPLKSSGGWPWSLLPWLRCAFQPTSLISFSQTGPPSTLETVKSNDKHFSFLFLRPGWPRRLSSSKDPKSSHV